jgi:hypothetical protein
MLQGYRIVAPRRSLQKENPMAHAYRRPLRLAITVFLTFAIVASFIVTGSAQAPVGQATMPSGTTFTWQAPWPEPTVGDDFISFLQEETITILNIDVFPATEHTAKSAATMDCGCGIDPLTDDVDGQGGHVQLGQYGTLDVETMELIVGLDFTRAWPTADGQWIIRTELQSRIDVFYADLTSVAPSITIDGAPLWGDIDPAAIVDQFEAVTGYIVPETAGAQPSAPTTTDAPATSGTGTTAPAGTLISWTDAWIYEPMEGLTSIVALYGVDVPATLWIYEGPAGQSVDAAWAEYSSTGGTVLDEGQTPDGGSYEVSMNEADAMFGGGPSYTLTRAYESDAAPIIASLIISGTDLQPSLEAARDVTTNGVSILDGVDDSTLIATFENEGPSGAAIFNGGEPSMPISEAPVANEPAVEPVSPEYILDNLPASLLPAPVETSGASYISDQFGYTLEWSDTWTPYDEGITADTEEGYDSYTLSSQGVGVGAINVYATAAGDQYGPTDYVDYWASEQFLDEYQANGTQVVLADSTRRSGAVVLVGPLSDDDPALWVTVYEIAVIDGALQIETSLMAPLEDIETVYDDAQNAITLDGEAVVGFFTTEEIVAALPAD